MEIKRSINNGFGLLCLCLVVCVSACQDTIEDPYDFYFKTPSLGETAKNIEILYSDSTFVQVRIKGPVMQRVNEAGQSREIFPEGVEIEFLDRQGAVTSWLTADYAVRKAGDKIVTLRENVLMRNTSDEKLRTSELIWNEGDGNIHTTKYVEITRSGEIIQGFGLKTNENMSEYEINAVTGRIKSDEIEKDFQ